ncbi:SEFIR domain-containing protein [Pedobacter africanus]|uniref:Uncharacterized protein n=1 Tax=Pedobacter africanus TaxID=151894 RepID=A0ACC6KYB2_9SPHI|nr:SEFIR domain-containing protein [Pedobacter africanus]MDR6784083.1 hypothetical protein [Pedobacter africanus]
MDTQDKRDLDRILNVLYKESPLAWYQIYTNLGIEKDRAEQLFLIGSAFNYLQVEHKGGQEYPTDNHYVGLTKDGIKFFALSNFSGTEKTVEPEPPKRYNLYISGSMGGFNLLDIDEEQLQIVVDAYLEGKAEFAIAGQNYHPKKFHTLKIFENTSSLNSRELKQIGRQEGSKRGFTGNFFSDEDLEEFGKELTMSIIGNAQFGSGKQINKVPVKQNNTSIDLSMENLQTVGASADDKPIFISYSWDSKDHEDHVFSFANELRKNGFNVDIDKIISQRKTSVNFTQMMHEAFVQSEHIIVVLSEGYKQKADTFQGGVGTEYRLILGEIDRFPRKYILVSFKGRDESIIPAGLNGRDVVDLSSNGLEPLFRKLTQQDEYVLSPISKNKPTLLKRQIAGFAEHQAKLNIKTETNKTSAELTAKRVEKKKQLLKDFSPWLNYKAGDQKKRFRMIIHSTESDTYPEQPMLPNFPPTWFAAEIYGYSYLGMEFCNENTQIYVDDHGNWNTEAAAHLKPLNVHVIRTIIYDDIVTWDMAGDGIYNCPHFYAVFTDGYPWAEIHYVDHNKKYPQFNSSNKIENAK